MAGYLTKSSSEHLSAFEIANNVETRTSLTWSRFIFINVVNGISAILLSLSMEVPFRRFSMFVAIRSISSINYYFTSFIISYIVTIYNNYK